MKNDCFKVDHAFESNDMVVGHVVILETVRIFIGDVDGN